MASDRGMQSSADGPAARKARDEPPGRDKDSEDEWEYEYSTTETETYYVTLDLSKPDFIARQQRTVLNGRGGYKEKSLGLNNLNKDDDVEVEGEGDGDREVLDDEDDGLQNGKGDDPERQGDGREPSDDRVHEVQILELHSENPLISYRGRVYEGQWAQNLGTEVLIAKHDEANPLPALRSLGDGVDLLAASSARITTVEKDLRPRSSETRTKKDAIFTTHSPEAEDEDEVDVGDVGSVPRAEAGSSQVRVEQGKFLAKFIALKKKKGEQDEVTIIAESHNTVARRHARTTGPPAWRKRRRDAGIVREPRGRKGPSIGQNSGLLSQFNEAGPSLTARATPEVVSSRPTPTTWSDLKDDNSALVMRNNPDSADETAGEEVNAGEEDDVEAADDDGQEAGVEADEMDVDG